MDPLLTTREDLRTQRNNLIIFILNWCNSKTPIKETELLKLFNKQKSDLKLCLNAAKESLKDAYGIILTEVPGTRNYICYSDVPAGSLLEFDEQQRKDISLLFLVLSFVLTKNGSVYEEEIFNYLNWWGVCANESHASFGSNVKTRITDTFVKQLYLTKQKSDAELDTTIRYKYSWGFRSKVEFREHDLLDMMSEMLNIPIRSFYKNHIEIEAESGDESMEGI